MTDPHDELSRAARKHRDDQAARAAPTKSPSEVAAERAQRERVVAEALVARSLGGGRLQSVATVIVALIALAAPVAVLGVVHGLDSFLLILGALLVGVVLVLAAVTALQRVFAGRHRRALHRIGHGFDADRYLALLSRMRKSSRLVVRLELAREIEPDQRALIADAVLGWVSSLPRPSWEGTSPPTLRLESAELDTQPWTTGSKYAPARRMFDNTRVHGSLTEIVERVVPPLHAAHPIARIDVEILGTVTEVDHG